AVRDGFKAFLADAPLTGAPRRVHVREQPQNSSPLNGRGWKAVDMQARVVLAPRGHAAFDLDGPETRTPRLEMAAIRRQEVIDELRSRRAETRHHAAQRLEIVAGEHRPAESSLDGFEADVLRRSDDSWREGLELATGRFESEVRQVEDGARLERGSCVERLTGRPGIGPVRDVNRRNWRHGQFARPEARAPLRCAAKPTFMMTGLAWLGGPIACISIL